MSDNHHDASDLRVIDLARLEKLGVETGLGTSGMAALFAEQMAYQLEDLYAAIQAGAVRSISAVAHRCLGSSSLAGMERLTALLRALETDPAGAVKDPEASLAAVGRAFADAMKVLQTLTGDSGVADVA